MYKSMPNNHTAGTSIYLFDSIAKQDIAHINQLHYAITAAIKNAHTTDNKTLTIYIDCPDTVIDERFQPTLNALHTAAQSGIILNIQNAGAQDSTYARVLNSIVEVAKMPPVTDSPFRKHMKQH